MKITNIKIRSFGVLVDREFDFAPTTNLIEGANESGKTSLAAFVKFALYGLDGKKGFPTEKDRYINRQTGRADGVMEFTHEGKAYRIERCVGDGVRETKRLIDLETLTPVKFAGEIGEYLFGVPESVFVNTAFIRQSSGSAVDSEEIKNAVANILSSADEKISVEKVVKKLDAARTKLKHKNTVGGRLRELDREIADAQSELEASRRSHAAVISATGDLAEKRAEVDRLAAENESYSLTLRLYDDMRALERRAKLQTALGEANAMKARLDESAASLPPQTLRGDAANARAAIASAEKALADAKAEMETLGEARQARFSPEQCASDRTDAATLEAAARSKRRVGLLMLLFGFTVLLAAVGTYFLIPHGSVAIKAGLAVFGAAALAAGIVLLAQSSAAKKKLGDVLSRWGVSDVEELEDEIEKAREAVAEQNALERERERVNERVAKASDVLEAAKNTAVSLYAANYGDPDGEGADGEGADSERENGELSPVAALDAIERKIAEAEAAHAAIDAEYRTKVGECRAMDENLSGVDFAGIEERREKYEGGDEWKIAASLDAAGRAEVEKKYRFNAEKIRALEKQCEDLKRLAYTTPGRTPAEIEERLSALEREKAEGELRLAGLELALETVENCGESLRRDLIPGIVSRASEAFAETTAMRHDRLALDGETFTLRTSGEDGAYEAELLSTGGADAAYVCLRRALTPALYRREAPPAIYDESFSAIDEDRAIKLIRLIAADDGQSLIFTCRRSEAERVGRELAPAVNVIRM